MAIFAAVAYLPDSTMAKAFLLKQAEKLTGQPIQVKQVNLTVFPDLGIQLFDVEVSNLNASLVSVKAQSLEADLSFWSLFQQTVIFDRVNLERPEIILRIPGNKKMGPSSSEEPIASRHDYSFDLPSIEELAIRNGSLTLIKDSDTQRTESLKIKDILVTLTSPSFSLPAEFLVAASLSHEKSGPSTLGISGTISRLPPDQLVDDRRWRNLPAFQITGQIEGSHLNIAEIEHVLEATNSDFGTIQGVIDFSTPIMLYPDVHGITLVLSDVQGRVDGIPVRGKVNLMGLLGAEPSFFTSFSSAPVSLQTFTSVIPPFLVHPDVQRVIDQYKIGAMIQIVNSVIAGSTAKEIGASILEVVQVTQGQFSVDQNLPPIHEVEGSVVWDHGVLRLENVAGEYQSTKVVDGRATIQFPESGPMVGLELKAQVDVENLVNTFTTLATDPKEWPETLTNLKGTGNLSLKAHGPLQEPENLVFETIHLQEGNFLVFQDLPLFHDVSGTLTKINDRVTLRGLKGDHGLSKILKANATVTFQDQGPWIDLEADTLFTVQEIRALMIRVDPTIELPPALKSLEGEGKLGISLRGPVMEPEKLVIETIQLNQGRFQVHQDLPLLQPVSARASFRDSTFQIADLNAAYRTSEFQSTSATITFFEGDPMVDMVLRAKVEAQDVIELLRYLEPSSEFLLPITELEEVGGSGQAIMDIQGPLNNLDQLVPVSGEIFVKDVHFRSPQIVLPITNLTGRAAVSKNEIHISSLSGEMGQSQAALRGTIGRRGLPTFQNVMLRARVQTTDLKKIQPEAFPETFQGAVQVGAVVSSNQESSDFKMNVDLKDLEFEIPEVIHKPMGMPTSFKFKGNVQDQRFFTVDQAILDLPHFEITGEGTFDTSAPFAVNATMETAPVSLASLPEDMLFGVEKFLTGDLTMALDVEGTGEDWRGWNIQGSAALENVMTTEAPSDDQPSNLSIDLRLSEEQDEANFRIERIPVKNLAALVGITELPLEGILWSKGSVRARIEPHQDPIPTLEGEFNLLVKDGVVHPGKTMSRLLSVLNLPALVKGKVKFNQDNLPFDTITGDVDIAKGILHTENLVLRGPVLMLSASGFHDFKSDQLELMAAASPLSSYGKYLGKVPFVNRLFGEDPRLLTVFFEVKGPVQDAKVKPLPLKTVKAGASGLIDLTVNALKTVGRLPGKVLGRDQN